MVVQWASPETLWCAVLVVLLVSEVVPLSGPNVCMVQQKYNITKRVKYRAPMSVRTYEWCFAMPPRCSRWNTEMRDLTRLETEERTAEVAVCCPGYKMKDVSCVPICPPGKMGHGCNEDCPPDKWGPNCVNECPECVNGFCVPSTGECDCEEGWQGESCQISMPTVQAAPALMEELLTTTKSTIKTLPTTTTVSTTRLIEPSTLSWTRKVTVTDTSTASTPSTTTTKPTSTKLTYVTPDKTESTVSPFIKSTQTTDSTSYFKYENVTSTPYTTEFVDFKTNEKLSRVAATNFIYNRTETPEEGTSNMTTYFLNEHETSTLSNPISIKSSKAPLTSSSITDIIDTSTTSTTTTTPSTTSTTTTTFPTPTSRKKVAISSIITSKATTTYIEDSSTIETTKGAESTTKNHFTTPKFKTKEIWIKPNQKGVPIFIETKVKNHETHAKFKSATHRNEATSEITTPKTIIVSIIPTSVSHATFKKIALTTASYLSYKFNSTTKNNKTEQSFTKSMNQASTAKPFTIKLLSNVSIKNNSSNVPTRFSKSDTTLKVAPSTKTIFLNTTMSTSEKHSTTMATLLNLSLATLNSTLPTLNTTMATSTTNSMSSTLNANKKLNSSTFLTIKSPTNKYTHKSTSEVTTEHIVSKKVFVKDETLNTANKNLHAYINGPIKVNNTSTVKKVNSSNGYVKIEVTTTKASTHISSNNSTRKINSKWNVTRSSTNNPVTTQEPIEDETFHILTEPEHITAVMNDKERDHTSVDLISVISIAGGVMMAIITVAVIIVMIERCKRPRYDDVRKVNDIRMQVMIDNKDPPPYVRSIFHTPLPDPPSDNCHYQPISTLDRNLKQFMRPVVVQAISPIMLENFRGILECHYDHLPNRNHRINHEFGTMPSRCSVSPSMKGDDELLRHRPLSVADYTIETLKCEAKMDILDNTTSEPLYAEIPCWRPPSEHAIEIMNLNGEAVTEL